MTLSKETFERHIESFVARPSKHDQGEVVFGVTTLRPETDSSSTKVFSDRARAESHLAGLPDFPLYKPEMHAVVFYRGVVSSSGPSDMRDTTVVSPAEEAIVTVTDITVFETWDVGDPVDTSVDD